MYLIIIKMQKKLRFSLAMLILTSTFSVAVSAVNDDMNIPVKLTVEEFKNQALNMTNQYVSVVGYIFLDSGYHLYSSLNLFNQLDPINRIEILQFEVNKLIPKKLSGCLVSITGKVRAHKFKASTFVLGDIRSVMRTGAFYFLAQEKMRANGINSEPKCYGTAIVELMSDNE